MADKRMFLVSGLSISLIFNACVQANNTDIYQKNQTQAETLYAQMTLDQKIGQLLQPSYALLANSVSPQGIDCKNAVTTTPTSREHLIKACGLDQIAQYHLGSVLMGGGPYFNDPTLANWAALNALATSQHEADKAVDPVLLIGNDAVHGNMHLQGAVIFPHNIGLGATHNPELVRQMASYVGQDSLASGFNWVFAPTVAIAQDLRWGRTYESFGQQGDLVKTLAKAYIDGLQGINQDGLLTGPLATAKHFIGDGATQYGLDEGDDAYVGNQQDFWQANGQGYEGAMQAQVATLMASYTAIDDAHTQNNSRMHLGGQWDLLNQFKGYGQWTGVKGTDGQMYRFHGLVISDWDAPTRAAYFYNQYHPPLSLAETMAKSINGGVDIIMLGSGAQSNPFDVNSQPSYTQVSDVVNAIKTAYSQGLISEARLKDAVTRVLAVKLALGRPTLVNYAELQAKERAVALQAAEQSLVLLQNKQATLPVNQAHIKHVIFVGQTNDLGVQNGGWTVNWQGQKTDRYFTGADKISSGALTLEEAVKQQLGTSVDYDGVAADITPANTIVIAAVAEVPYAEYMGDIANPIQIDQWYQFGVETNSNAYLGLPQSQWLGLQFSPKEAALLAGFKAKQLRIITVVYSGRPVILSEGGVQAPLTSSDAVIAAFLPGTLGGKALSQAIFGAYRFKSQANGASNTLTFPWPSHMAQVADHFQSGYLFPIGYGLKD